MSSFLRKSWSYIILPFLVAVFIFYILQNPKFSGVQVLSNKYNPITIRRDQYGVPSIESKTLKDTLYGLGYAQAQDRLWALYTRKFLVSGRVSEIAGAKTVPVDKFFRNIGMKRYCEYALEYIDADTRALFQAFADGINDYVASTAVLPLEFWLTWSKFEEYTALDTLVGAKFVAFFLTFDFQFEFIFDTLSDVLGPKMAGEIMPYKGENYLWNNVVVMDDDELKQAGIYEKFDENKRYSEINGFEFPEERRPPKSSSSTQNQSNQKVNQQTPPSETPRNAASDKQKVTSQTTTNNVQGATDSTNQAQNSPPPSQSAGTTSSTQTTTANQQKTVASDSQKTRGRPATSKPQGKTASTDQTSGTDATKTTSDRQKTASKANEDKVIGESLNGVMPEAQIGSNSWVVHGDHTTTGKPILANDPHLMNGIPTVWYPSSLFYEDGYASGVGVVGFPGIQIGQTHYASWGITTLCSDTSDLYTLKTKDNKYFYENEWHPMKEFKEVIRVKGQTEPIEITIYETHHGVVLDYYFAEIFITRNFMPEEGRRYALAWPGFQKKDEAYKAFFKMLAAKNSQDIIDAWEDALEPAFSLLFATTQGDIGFLGIGKIPLRKNPIAGIRPQDGSLKENDWLGYVPWSDQPKIVNPKKGYIVSANNKMASDNIKWSTSSTLFPTSRAARIDEMIREYTTKGNKISVKDMIDMQDDTLDVLAREVVPIMINRTRDALHEGYPLSVSNEDLNRLLQNLTGWDYVTGKTSVPATIFNVWERFFVRTMMQKMGLDPADVPRLIAGGKFDHFLYRGVLQWDRSVPKDHNNWCRNDENAQYEDPCLYNLARSLEQAYLHLVKGFGSDLDEWQWEKVHVMDYPHGTFSPTPLRSIFHRTTPAQGNGRTVNVARMKMETDSFAGVWSANLKMVTSLKEGDSSFFIVDTGVSGSIFSTHYDDQMELYAQGKYLEMAQEIDKNSKDTLYLKFK